MVLELLGSNMRTQREMNGMSGKNKREQLH